MPVYRCSEGPLTVMFGYDSFTFANNQLVNTNFPQIINHPSFEIVTDPRLIKRAPPINKIFPMPTPTTFLSNDQLVDEIKTYGVQPDPYDLTDKLAYQLEMLRSLNKRSNVTVLDDDGEPMWYEEYFALEQKLKAKAREKHPVNTPEVRVSKKDLEPKKKEKKLASKEEVKKKGGSIGSIDMNDDYDITREHEVDGLIKAQLEKKFQSKVDKVINDKDPLFGEQDIEVDIGEIGIKDFEHLVELKPFCMDEFTEDERNNLKYKNLRYVSLPVVFAFLRHKGIVHKFGRNSDRGFKFREVINNLYKSSPRKQEYIIEINALIKRSKEIEATTPKDVRKCSARSIKLRISRLQKYGIETRYRSDSTLSELRRIYSRYVTLCQFGLKEVEHEKIFETLEEYELGDIIQEYLIINTNGTLEEELSNE